jgi:pantoate--beta-alanine ligase
MIVCRTIAELRAGLGGGRWALAPTMGALHAGHMALVAEARRHAPNVAASIFVNPTQFGPNEDLSRYPRDDAGDLAQLAAAGCDLVWLPTVETMYPPGDATTITVGGPSEGFEGAIRPGHFRGMATVVAKLLHQTNPAAVMFGEKDWQQLQVVRRMAVDLHWPVEVIAVPTVREPDGLAMSSRNRYLTAEQRAIAGQLHAVLQQVAARAGRPGALAAGASALQEAGLAMDYLALVEAATLRPTDTPKGARLIAAARLGSVRLLDNVAVSQLPHDNAS